MDIYDFINQKYREQQLTGKSSIKFPEFKIKNKNKEEIKLGFYSCGHSVKAVIVKTTEESLSTYFEWKESKSDLCLDCWLKERSKL